MANVVRVRVEARKSNKPGDREKNFKILLQEFKRACSDACIAQLYKDYQFFESKADKKKRKRKLNKMKRQQEQSYDELF